jgi:hypothetical protein
MARGGKRSGAGRPKGAVNKRTKEMAEAIAASGLTPLDYMIAVMRDEKREPALRLDAAKSPAPYIHSRLASQELTIINPAKRSRERNYSGSCSRATRV